MTRRGILRAVAANIGLLALSGCDVLFESNVHTTRYKITVEVQTPQGVRTGFAVREVKTSVNHGANGLGSSIRERGEAVAVDLGDGKILFALLRGVRLEEGEYGALMIGVAQHAHKEAGLFGAAVAEIYPIVALPRGNPDRNPLLDDDDYAPMLVTFRDSHDSKSVEQVAPADLAAAFGPGVMLKRIAVELSNEAVTTGIAKRLESIGIEKKQSLDKDFRAAIHPSLAQKLSYDDFSETSANW